MAAIADRRLAQECVGMLERRWSHVQAVGRTADELAEYTALPETVVRAAWLHDVGYGPAVRSTGFHPLDGARFLERVGVDHRIVSLVAYHTGATYEADERGLSADLAEFAEPDPDQLAMLTMIDISCGPDGSRVLDSERIAEILQRYPTTHPVGRAVRRSQPVLLESSKRAKQTLGLPDDWPLNEHSPLPAPPADHLNNDDGQDMG